MELGYNVELLGALIGLAKTCCNFPRKETTNELIVRGLRILASGTAEISSIVDELHSEKLRLAPGCTECSARCGNTDDYDVSELDAADDDIQEIKKEIIHTVVELALGEPNSDDVQFICTALFAVSQDWENEHLRRLLYGCPEEE